MALGHFNFQATDEAFLGAGSDLINYVAPDLGMFSMSHPCSPLPCLDNSTFIPLTFHFSQQLGKGKKSKRFGVSM